MTTTDNLPPLPMQTKSEFPNVCYYTTKQMKAYALESIAQQAERITALTEKCTLYAASMKQANKRVAELEAEREVLNSDIRILAKELVAARQPVFVVNANLKEDGTDQSDALQEAFDLAALQPVEAEQVAWACPLDERHQPLEKPDIEWGKDNPWEEQYGPFPLFRRSATHPAPVEAAAGVERDKVLEEAAMVCDDLAKAMRKKMLTGDDQRKCAAAIRALKASTAQK